MSDGFEFNLRGLVAQINDLERKLLPRAQAGTLNTIAFNVRKALLKHADDTIEGGPTAFTRRGFVVDRAMPTTVNMASAVKILPNQARYLRYIIDGGVRRAGDPGAGQYDIMVEGAETTEQGNVKRGFLKRTAKAAKAERIKRTRLRDKREKMSSAGKDATAFEWNVQGKGEPGTFFAEVNGIRGYWERPDPDNWQMNLTLLTRFADEAVHEPSFDWDGVVTKSVSKQDLTAIFAAELARAVGKSK
ncbi:hypothetical protein [Pararhizobium sp.]|uniref:hypothetical protein n=1 Tax=Pararhizobium sp. TaxID=1977563 RepID=UPI003D130D3A